MDITIDQEKSSTSEKEISPYLSDHVIPQMVITSADDASEEQKNVSECTLVLIPPSAKNSTAEIQTTNSLDESNKSKESSNVILQRKPDVNLEDISNVVNDVVTKCSENIPHTTIQRPLVIEVEKNTPKQEESSVRCPTPPPPPPPVITSPSIMQRPLVFEAVSTPEIITVIDAQPKEEVDSTLEMQDDLNLDLTVDALESTKSAPTKKEGLHGVKKFFDSLLSSDSQEVESTDVTVSKEFEAPTDVTKSEKIPIKKVPHTSKPTPEKDKVQALPLSESPTVSKETTSFAKDAKQSIKAFFDTFKHEPSDSIDKNETQLKTVQTDISKETSKTEVEPAVLEQQKDGKSPASFAKDTKQNIKAFFDSFKPEHSEHKGQKKPEVSIDIQHEMDLSSDINKDKEKSPKDKKQNIKSFFDSFKPETSESKQKIDQQKISEVKLQEKEGAEKQTYQERLKTSTKQDSISASEDVSKTVKPKEIHVPLESEVFKEKEKSPKDKKQGKKSFFESKLMFGKESKDESIDKDLKMHEKKTESAFSVEDTRKDITSTDLNTPQELLDISKKKETSSKDKKQNIKSFFDSFKHETSQSKQTDAQDKKLETKQSCDESIMIPEKSKESVSFVKETKQNIKALFDTFKHDPNEPKSKDTLTKTSTLSEPDLHKKSEQTTVTKDGKHPLKKFFSFKHINNEGCENIDLELTSNLGKSEISKDKPIKEVKSVKLDLKPTYSSDGFDLKHMSDSLNVNDQDRRIEIKERAQSVPSDSLERSRNSNVLPETLSHKAGASSDVLSSEDRQVERGSRHSIKKFFDSFKHEKSDLERSSSVDHKTEKSKKVTAGAPLIVNEESKGLEKPAKEKKAKEVKRSFSDKMSREEVVQNFKGFFDSISHRSSKKSAKDQEHIYDTVEVKPEFDIAIPVLPSEVSKAATSSEKEMKIVPSSYPIKSPLSEPSSSKTDASKNKFSLRTESDLNKSVKAKDYPQSSITSATVDIKIISASESDISKQATESVSVKPDKGSVLSSIGENILALKERVLHGKEKRKSGIIDTSEEIPTVKADEDKIKSLQSSATVSASTTDGPDKENICKVKPQVAKKPTPKKTKAPESNTSPSSPNSLYDSCCMKLAVLLRDKAVDVVSKHTKTPPPPKPPKPSAETIARARAAAVARRLEAQRLARSIGDNLPMGYDGIRFADDDTESSCDYKDVENFDYIMDYELINRYKLDSSKLDTFSVPSTSSGMTSYYTCDSLTMRDENFSDAAMETVSLSSDISYSLKNFSYVSGSEPVSMKSSQPISKQPTVKKVPPPIPPKPLVLNTLSKKKATEPNVSQCVNGLSLSPRLQKKDNVATLKRPLMVADVKETQFSSLQHSKSKHCPPKPTRSFNTVLKNESLKNISDIPKSSSTSKLPSLQHTPRSLTKQTIVSHDGSLPSFEKLEKRTKSPPRPPPPTVARKPTPQRPPPPVKVLKDIDSEVKIEDKPEYDVPKSELSEREKLVNGECNVIHSSSTGEANQVSNFIADENINAIHHKHADVFQENVPRHFSDIDLNKHDDNLNNNITAIDSLNNNSEINLEIPIETPKPPPRNRRIRSRTVEVVPSEPCVERQKRSQSLSDIDVEKRVSFLTAEKTDSKSLYTTINKDGKRLNNKVTASSSPDLVSGRPLPAPPPPPRKFRSLERKKHKDIENRTEEQTIKPFDSTDEIIKAPARRKKTDKERFLSLHGEHKRQCDSSVEDLKRASSLPIRPSRKAKSFSKDRYDVNANISVNESPQQTVDSPIPDIPSRSRTNSPSKKRSSSERDRSSWYYENESLNQSWEFVNFANCPENQDEPKPPARRKLEIKRKSRETSKFYVNMEEQSMPQPTHKATSPLPLVDKETSPLPLDCSEKSVQTSLETLSQGVASSHDDEKSEDTDELLDLAQTLQKELSTIINRHKVVEDSTEEASSPSLSEATSEKNLDDGYKKVKTASVRSSTSDVWPLSSSDESDVDREGEDSSNVNEIAIKKKQKKIFYIAQEIMSSEEAFVDALKLLNIDFKSAVEMASKQRNMCIIPDDTLSQILNHLPQLQHLNENLLMELKDRIENWDKSEKIADIIVKMGPFLKLYSWYIHDFESNLSLLEECKKKYPAFAQVVKEFEMSPRCKKLSLNHYMLKPIQRIPQYRLLLQEYLHHLTEDSKDYQDTVTALQIVSEVANHANDSMKLGDNAQKLISIQNSIMGHKEIVKPGRLFVKEGELMKLSRKGMQPRWFILFNDLLLYLTPVQQGLYRVNHELPLTGMKVAIPIQQDYQNEFSIISVTRSFTLAARSPEERQEWIIALTKAIEENASKRSTFTNIRLHQKAQGKTSSEDEGAFVLGKKAPVWIPDARVTMCQLCTSEFTVTFRRHHCRACGKVVCSICSSHRISLPYLGNRIARVCDECHTHLGQGSSACTESGETDSDNQQIAVKPHLRTDNRHIKKNKRMLPSVLKEVCANDQGSTISGYLHKKVGKSWKRDWFVVKDKVLYEYRASEDVAALKSIPLLGYQIELFTEAYEGIESSLLFQLTHPGQAPIIFYTDSASATERWVSALKTATVLE